MVRKLKCFHTISNVEWVECIYSVCLYQESRISNGVRNQPVYNLIAGALEKALLSPLGLSAIRHTSNWPMKNKSQTENGLFWFMSSYFCSIRRETIDHLPLPVLILIYENCFDIFRRKVYSSILLLDCFYQWKTTFRFLTFFRQVNFNSNAAVKFGKFRAYLWIKSLVSTFNSRASQIFQVKNA